MSVDSLLDDESKIQRMEEHKEKEHGGEDKKDGKGSKRMRYIILSVCCVAAILICAITMLIPKERSIENIKSLEREKIDISVVEELPIIWQVGRKI